MLSHCCASCGRSLDASSRSYSHSLAMWIARCPGCGFAVRWAPRAAREPVRVWARLRALNTRLGIAVSCGQGAGGFAALTAGLLAELLNARIMSLAKSLGHDGPLGLAAVVAGQPEFLIPATATALLGTISAIAFSDRRGVRGILVRWLLAWTVGALPVALLIGAFGLAVGGLSVQREVERLWLLPAVTVLLLGAVPLASLALTAAIAPMVDRGFALLARPSRRKLRAARATTDRRRPTALSAT